MCPSYMATRDEADSTRGRANALRLAISGQLGEEGFTDEQLYSVLDLCLECNPRGASYWYGQCLSIAADPGIERLGRVPSSPTEPGFDPDLLDCADQTLAGYGLPLATCEGIEVLPWDDVSQPNDLHRDQLHNSVDVVHPADSDMVVVESRTPVEVHTTGRTRSGGVQRQEYRQLFAKLRRG